jgi:hypothetical protein
MVEPAGRTITTVSRAEGARPGAWRRRGWRAAAVSVVAVLSVGGGFGLSAVGGPSGAYSGGEPLPPTHVDRFTGKPRVVVLSDMGNEPDDQMSFVRLLVYSNQLDIEGLVATTSTWQRDVVHPETMLEIVDAYGQVRPNLLRHERGWPAVERLRSIVTSGQPAYGMAAVGPGEMSSGAEAIVRAVDRRDPRPVWVSVWGGANTLAQALLHVRETRSAAEVAAFVRKLRVYSISDQDDAGPWIRRNFPALHYIVKPSPPNGEEYYYATWTGISGDVYYRNGEGADFRTVTNEWLEANIRSKGPLGAHYPDYAFIMEGDTPAYLGLLGNGLESYRNPSWGGWGGRYVFRQPYGETRPIWSQGGDLFPRVTSQDTVIGVDGRPHTSDQATIWRWREAFQHDFAARMDWTVQPYARANHNPQVRLNGRAGTAPVVVDARVGAPVTLDAAGTRDPDRNGLRYTWFHYQEAGFGTAPALAAVRLSAAHGPRITVTPTATCRPQWLPGAPCPATGVAHVILAVTDTGSPTLTTYRRVVLNVQQ